MSLSDKELEIHRQLLAAFDEYIRLNLRWEDKEHRIDAVRVRKSLRQIMNISYLRWQEVLYRMKDGDEDEEMVLKEGGIALIKSLHAAKKRNSNSEEDDNTST